MRAFQETASSALSIPAKPLPPPPPPPPSSSSSRSDV
ncbi:unnamed protein product [Spirodela intermedia]|uniref:Uncharacterized protein n=1 Tax=Spirodela intermedia TaxID=51605 RepID=A0A7I8LIM1_SPIIN|nr:unnamed protein product [Spirodela intermedia]